MSALFLHPVCMIMVLRSSISFCRYLMVSLLQQWSLCGFLKSNSLKSCWPCLQYPKFITVNIRVKLDKTHSFFKLFYNFDKYKIRKYITLVHALSFSSKFCFKFVKNHQFILSSFIDVDEFPEICLKKRRLFSFSWHLVQTVSAVWLVVRERRCISKGIDLFLLAIPLKIILLYSSYRV